jgi:hypothetical protein
MSRANGKFLVDSDPTYASNWELFWSVEIGMVGSALQSMVFNICIARKFSWSVEIGPVRILGYPPRDRKMRTYCVMAACLICFVL